MSVGPLGRARRWRESPAFFSSLLRSGFGVRLKALGRRDPGPWDWAAVTENALLYFAAMFIAIAVHEGGHLAAALALDFEVFGVAVGMGGVGKIVRLGQVEVHLRSFPWSGFTRCLPRSERLHNLRTWVMVAAGPAATIAFLAVLLRVADGRASLAFDDLTRRASPLEALVFANWVIAFVNLLPIPTRSGRSDGLQLLVLPFTGRKRVAQLKTTRALLHANRFRERGEPHEAVRILDELAKEAPGELVIRNDLGVALMEAGDYGRAREIFGPLAEDPKVPKGLYVLALNNRAWAELHLPDADLEAANRWSSTALRHAPAHPSLRGTRGCVLTALGRAEEAIPFLVLAIRGHIEPKPRAANAAWLALAHHKVGHIGESRRWMEEARALDPNCVELEHCTKLMGIEQQDQIAAS